MYKFWNGKKVMIVAPMPGSHTTVIARIVEDYNKPFGITPNDTLVTESDLEPLVTDVYKLGDKVKSLVGDLTGVVTAFELHTNRVVVISDKIANYRKKDQRARYTYELSEIEPNDNSKKVFAQGFWYKINDVLEVMAVESVFDENEVMLFNRNGEIVFKNIPRVADKKLLKEVFKISSVQKMKGMSIK